MELILLNEESTFKEWAEKWKKHKLIGVCPAYKAAINSQVNYLAGFLGDIAINEIKPIYIDELISNLAAENPKTHRPSSKNCLRI